MFGDAVALSGNTALVSEIRGVTVYRRADETSCAWWLEAEFFPLPADEACNCWFGSTVALDGDVAVIGSRDSFVNTPGGRVYIHWRSGSVWTLEATLEGISFGANSLGVDVAVQGSTCVALGTNGVCVFEESGGTWSLVAQFPTVYDHSVSVDGDRFVTGSLGNQVNGLSRVGEAFVYKRNPNGWAFEQTLQASDPKIQAFFGRDVDVDGDTIVIGADGGLVDDYYPVEGAAYVFFFDGLQWVEQQKLQALNPAAENAFGQSVAIRGDTVLVADLIDDSVANNSGAVCRYQRSGTTWTLQPLLTASDAAASDFFGNAADVDRDPNGDPVMLVGAWGDNRVNGVSQGAAYV